MRAADYLILGAILSVGGGLLLKIEKILRPDENEGVVEKLAAVGIYFAGIVLGIVGIWGVIG